MTNEERSQLWLKIVEQAENNPAYYSKLKADPRGLMKLQIGELPRDVKITVLEESANEYYIVLPHTIKDGAELSDSDLAIPVGGATVKGDANCWSGGAAPVGTTVVEVGGF